MRKVSPPERLLLQAVSFAGGRHCFSVEDKVTRKAHQMLRSMDARGLVTVEPTDDGPLVTITAAGKAELE